MELFSVSPIIIIAAACGWAGVWGDAAATHIYSSCRQQVCGHQYSTVQYSKVQ